MPLHINKRFRHRRQQEAAHRLTEQSNAVQLKQKVWGFNHGLPPTSAYEHHYRQLRGSTKILVSEAIDLVDRVRNQRQSSLQTIKYQLRLSAPQLDDAAVEEAFEFATQLWLFIKPASRGELTIQQSILESLKNARICNEEPSTDVLSSDFSAKSLMRKGRFKFVGTSDLSEHLTIKSGSYIRIFRHASILHQYEKSAVESGLYPPNFLRETADTMLLLFPRDGPKHSRYARRARVKYDIDLEAQLKDVEAQLIDEGQFDLANYPFWAHRLTEIQKRYDDAKPSHITQWWYDRRQRGEWAVLLVAVIVFILTVVFGVVASVTSILQVHYARYPPRLSN